MRRSIRSSQAASIALLAAMFVRMGSAVASEPGQPSTRCEADDRGEALALFKEAVPAGNDAVAHGSIPGALEAATKLERAFSLYSMPQIAVWQAYFLRAAQKPNAAERAYRAALSVDLSRCNLPPKSHAAQLNAQSEAREELKKLAPHVTVRVVAPDPLPPGAVLKLDDTELTSASAREFEVRPGTHELTLSVGSHSAKETIHVNAGDPPRNVDLSLSKDRSTAKGPRVSVAPSPPAAPQSPTAPTVPPANTPPQFRPTPVFWIAGGTLFAGAVATSVFFVNGKSAESDFERSRSRYEDLPPTASRSEESAAWQAMTDDESKVHSQQTLITIGAVVTGAAALATIYGVVQGFQPDHTSNQQLGGPPNPLTFAF